MRRIFFGFLFILNFGWMHVGYSQKTEWLTTIRPGGNEYVWDVCTDKSGNVLATGRVKFSSTFGWSPNTQTPAQYGVETDVFISKYDPNGNLIWVKREGGYEPDWGRSVATDSENSVYVVGDYCDTAFFGSDTIIAVGAFQNRNAFFVKYDSAGVEQWVKTAGNIGNHSRAYSVAVDESNNSYICGHVSGSSNFDGIGFGVDNYNLPFFARFNSSGICEWAKHIPINISGEANSIAYKDGFIYVVGMYKGTMIINANSFPGNSTSWNDVFITKWDTLGNFIWAKTGKGQFQDIAYDVTVDRNENIYVIGTYANDLSFGTDTTIWSMGTSANATLANTNTDFFVVKYDSNGNYQWVKTANSRSGLGGASIIGSNKSDIIYFSGGIRDTTYFNGDTIYSNNNTLDIFISAVNVNGDILWYKTIGANGNDNGKSIGLDNFNNIIYGGYFQNTVNFDTITSTALNGDDAYIGKMVPPLLPQINFSDTVACAGDSILFYAAQDGAVSYQWLKDGNPVPAGVSDSASIGFSAGGMHEISLVLSNYFDTDTVVVGIYQVYDKPIVYLGNDTSLCDGSSLNLDAGIFPVYSWSDGSAQQFLGISSGGSYWVLVADTNGCTNSDSISVSYFSPVAVSLGPDTTLCDTLQLVLDPGVFNSYLWSDNSTGQVLMVGQTGMYSVQITDTNQCPGYDTVSVVFDSCLSNDLFEDMVSPYVYPNPFTDRFQVNFGRKITGFWQLFDISGQLIFSDTFIDLPSLHVHPHAGLSSGIYHVIVFTRDQEFFRTTLIRQ